MLKIILIIVIEKSIDFSITIKQRMDIMKKIFKLSFIILLIFALFFMLSNDSFAADPKIVTTIKKAFEQIKDWIIKIATPAAAVAVGTGILMRKFSFGDEEKIRTGKKLIRGALFSYAFILAIDLILSAIKTLVGA